MKAKKNLKFCFSQNFLFQ